MDEKYDPSSDELVKLPPQLKKGSIVVWKGEGFPTNNDCSFLTVTEVTSRVITVEGGQGGLKWKRSIPTYDSGTITPMGASALPKNMNFKDGQWERVEEGEEDMPSKYQTKKDGVKSPKGQWVWRSGLTVGSMCSWVVKDSRTDADEPVIARVTKLNLKDNSMDLAQEAPHPDLEQQIIWTASLKLPTRSILKIDDKSPFIRPKEVPLRRNRSGDRSPEGGKPYTLEPVTE